MSKKNSDDDELQTENHPIGEAESAPLYSFEDAGLAPLEPAPSLHDLLHQFEPALSSGTYRRFNPSIIALLFIFAVSGFYFGVATALLFGIFLFSCLTLFISLPAFLARVRKRTSFVSDLDARRLDDGDLPIYSVLIPLYDEAAMLPQIYEAMGALDYPASRLDIQILLEADDLTTQAAARMIKWDAHIRLTIIPDGEPRTKPRACNYGLALARGRYLVIYDAEDRPTPLQLREAVAAFTQMDDKIICLQAPLLITRSDKPWWTPRGWLQANFRLEYQMIFKVLFPTMIHYQQPMPLSGTSNHFRIHTLRQILGWDSYNLTEDADLGVRLARRGLRTQMLVCPTYENPPHTWSIWYWQRIRWISGHIQTWCVHMRTPFKLIGEIGLIGTLCFTAITATRVLSGMAHTTVIGIGIWKFSYLLEFFTRNYFGVAALILYGLWMSLSLLAITRARDWKGLFIIPSLPLYWIVLALPAAHALYRIITRQHFWHKSQHVPYDMPHDMPHDTRGAKKTTAIKPRSPHH